MYKVNQYTIERGDQPGNMLNDFLFETVEEARDLFGSIDLAAEFRTEYNCRASKGSMREVVFCKEITDEETGECAEYAEYTYSDFERDEEGE